MTNTKTFDYTNKAFQDTTVAVMNDILASDAKGSSMDDVYETLCKYVKVTKEEFNDLYKQASDSLSAWKEDGMFGNELSDEQLDLIAGGSIGSFFESIGNGLKTAANAVDNFVKQNAGILGCIAGILVLAAGVTMACTGNAAGLLVAAGGVYMMYKADKW